MQDVRDVFYRTTTLEFLRKKVGTRGSNVEPAMAAAGGSLPPLATGTDDASALTATGAVHLPSDIPEIVVDLHAKNQLAIVEEDYKATEFFKEAAEMVTTTGVEVSARLPSRLCRPQTLS